MREHKYKAWDKKQKKWLGVNLHMSVVDGLLWWQFGYGCEILSAEERENIEMVEYMSLKDKNGVEIYEGDILKFLYLDENKKVMLASGIYLIEWSDEVCGFICERQEPYNYLLSGIWHECEIIGNIYENPELVGGKPMRDKTIDLNAQAGNGVRAICNAIEGLKAWKREYKEQTGMDLDITSHLKGIRSNLNDLIEITEGDKEEEEFYAILNRCSGVSK